MKNETWRVVTKTLTITRNHVKNVENKIGNGSVAATTAQLFCYYVIMSVYPLVALFESSTERINTLSVRLEYCKTSYASYAAGRTGGWHGGHSGCLAYDAHDWRCTRVHRTSESEYSICKAHRVFKHYKVQRLQSAHIDS